MESPDIADSSGNQPGVNLLEAADGLRVGDHQSDAVDNRLGAQRGDEGRHPQLGNDQAVDGANHKTDGDDNEQHQENIHFRNALPQTAGVVRPLAENAGKAGSQAHLAACGQVGALGDEAAGNAQGNQEPDSRVAQKVGQVRPGEEVVHDAAHNDCRDDEKEGNGVALNQSPDLVCDAPHRGSALHLHHGSAGILL